VLWKRSDKDIVNDRAQTSALMEILLTLLPHLNNAEDYFNKLFDQTFSEALFNWLPAANLDEGLQLVTRHFPLNKESPAYQFIVTQCSQHFFNL
jgi:hypothetical protein